MSVRSPRSYMRVSLPRGLPLLTYCSATMPRGVVERAIHLGSNIGVREQLVRPPYNSDWPDIPSEDSLKPLTPNRDGGARDDRELEWSRNRIRSSVMDDDFAWYVIGTNAGATNWLSLRLSEEPWKSPRERKAHLVSKLSEPARTAWEEFQRAMAEQPIVIQFSPEAFPDGDRRFVLSDEHDVELARDRVECCKKRLMALLTEDQRTEFESILRAEREGVPRFDLRKIQRYILWRVFDLGWTAERFGAFDRFSIGYPGREAAKPESTDAEWPWGWNKG